MSIQIAFSTKPLPEAVAELSAAIALGQPRLLLFFASASYDPAVLSSQMSSAFPQACVMGCSTAGEIAAGKMLTGSVTVMALDAEVVSDVAVTVVDDLSGEFDVSSALGRLEQHFQSNRSDWDVRKYVGVVLADGLSGAEERLLERLGDTTDVFFVGGSAGDDLNFKSTHVFAGGRAYRNAAVLALLRLNHDFEIVKTQSFVTTGKALVATKVDEAHRTVVEFDHKPAVQAYAEVLGVRPEDIADSFFGHPLGLMVRGEPFVRSPQRADEGRIVFYCQIREGTQLEVLSATDIVADTRSAIEAKKTASAPIRGLIDFQCILRTLQLRGEKRCDEYGAIFAGIPMAGFSTYGEAYLGHMNQTSTILLFR